MDETDRVLLVKFADPSRRVEWWAAPGGALKPGESHEQAIAREVQEETGLKTIDVGPWIWTREHVFELRSVHYRNRERFYLVRVTAFDPAFTELDVDEADYVSELRWWTAAELAATHDEISPRNLASLVEELLDGGPPEVPIEVGI